MADWITAITDVVSGVFRNNDIYLTDRAYCGRIVMNEIGRHNHSGGTTNQGLTTFIRNRQDRRLKYWDVVVSDLIVMSRVVKIGTRYYSQIPNNDVPLIPEIENNGMIRRISESHNDGVSFEGILRYMERHFGQVDEASLSKTLISSVFRGVVVQDRKFLFKLRFQQN
ncbi:hypothetical protein AVEN_118637-1 [Araneus ventricosus]|uniref:Uncharacterized protein n=1 Tax=Araneus ventricosus TaxID=182803 RepID=A0A4Y2AZF9_ARAVE|nr:hypothetical protein AVEN_118637-1 [Araneus ventricosus]